MQKSNDETIEAKRDAAQAAVDAAEVRLEQARDAVRVASAAMDGTDERATAWEDAKRAVARREVEVRNLIAKVDELDRQRRDVAAARARAEYDPLLARVGYRAFRDGVVEVAREALAHALALQAALESARALVRQHAADVRRVNELARVLVENPIVSAVDEDEATTVFAAALVHFARAAGARIEPLEIEPPVALRTDVGHEGLEVMVAVPRESVERSRIAASRRRQIETHLTGENR